MRTAHPRTSSTTPRTAASRAPAPATRAPGAPAPNASPVGRSTGCPCAGSCPRCTSASPGRPLDAGIRRRAERGFGAELSGVRVHTDPAAADAARAEGARAFTAGHDVYFARGQYAPHTPDGERRLVHELSHVVQQRRGAPAGGVTASRYAAAEREGRHAADTVLGGGRAELRERTAGAVQRDGPADAPPAPRLTDPNAYQLNLDPQLQRLMAQNYLRWWVGSSLTTGTPTVDTGTEGGGATPGVPAPNEYTPPALPSDELPPTFFRPIAPDVLGPDVGAIMAPYGNRSIPLGSRDVDAAMAVYRSNFLFVSALPDLRAMAPAWLRPIIPSDWRRSIAGAFTSATIDAQLRHDFPTPIEAADRAYEHMTGVSTTYLPIPGFSF